MIEDVSKFMQAFGQTTDTFNYKQSYLYYKLVDEEFNELVSAVKDVDELDAICDLIWVAIGYALSNGWDIEGAFKEVARSNMSKLGPDGKPIFRADGKVMKPETWSAPKLEQFLNSSK